MSKMNIYWRYIFIYISIWPNEDNSFQSNLETKTFRLSNIFESYLTLQTAQPIFTKKYG